MKLAMVFTKIVLTLVAKETTNRTFEKNTMLLAFSSSKYSFADRE